MLNTFGDDGKGAFLHYFIVVQKRERKDVWHWNDGTMK